MCDYCINHGAGKKWYLQAKNYLKNYQEDRKRRKFIKDFVSHFMSNYEKYLKTGEIKRMLDTDNPNWIYRKMLNWYFKNKHSGQVVPQEDAKIILELAGQVALIPCVCRMANTGIKKKLCMVFMHIPEDRWGYSHLQGKRDIEPLELEEAKIKIDEFANDGMIQTVWTFQTPHIGALCNCDYPYCTAVRFRKNTDLIRSLFRSEYIAKIDDKKCTNCRKCMTVCQFGAINYSGSTNSIELNTLNCFGCGICRNKCSKNAIELIPRTDNSNTREIW